MQTTNSREVIVDGQAVICRELTVLQVRDWLSEMINPTQTDPLEGALFKDCGLAEIKRMTDLSDDRINAMRPSQLEQVIAVCKELNPHFFGLLGRVAAIPAQQ
ncbi:hypothetical protein [Stutzerimonas nitrititolerans]|uniref:hypothetical protein n=1 Tax=Stutzerimonas nitrititolerans TaxID=2482751 RepID=UPI0028A2A464|nr:hypothetical protein [Stutzerimonas nitrititolerans]